MPKEFTPEDILQMIRQVGILSLAVSDNSGQPQSHKMMFAVDDDFTFYFATSSSSQKAKTLAENPKVGLSIWNNQLILLQVQGVVELLEGKDVDTTIEKLANVAADMPSFWPPVLQIKKDSYAVYKVKPTAIRALDLTSTTISNNFDMFTDIGAQL